jgi:NAD(P)-dependent dehydrogenase (short-subunit alcohol dehydrogenase family)
VSPELAGLRAFVLGGTRGIGRAISAELAAAGARFLAAELAPRGVAVNIVAPGPTGQLVFSDGGYSLL